MDLLTQTITDIKSLNIQGATAVAKSAISALIEYGKTQDNTQKDFLVKIKNAADLLKNTRPTEPLLQNGLDFILSSLQKNPSSLISSGTDFLNRIELSQKQVVKNGVDLIKNDFNIITHCHSSSVIGLIEQAARQGVRFKIFTTETRPLLQGQNTARELLKTGLDVTLMTDSEAAHIIGPDDPIQIDLVLLGVDSIAVNGSCANKVGSYGIALAAHEARVPLYIVSTLLKIDKRTIGSGEIPIEQRSPDEIWAGAPKDLKITNPAFDIIPSKFITGYVTEFGTILPGRVKDIAFKNYPFLMEKI